MRTTRVIPIVLALLCVAAGTASADSVTGTFRYQDTEADPNGGGTTEFYRLIVGCKVQVWRAGLLARTTETNSDGSFNVDVPHMPDRTDTTVVIYATNAAAQVLGGIGPFFVRRTLLSFGTAPLDFSEQFAAPEQIRSFNAAEDIRLAHNFAQARRDALETEVIPTVDVSFIRDEGLMTHYNPLGSGLTIQYRHDSRDLVIVHEYAHFLEDKIGSFLVLPSYHDTCFTSQRCQDPAQCNNLPGLPAQTQLINSPENAWMEGFADYFAMAVTRANPSGRFNLTSGGTMSESELNAAGTCDAVGRAAFDGRTIDGEMIEKFVASVLWEASRSPGSDLAVFQIFDHELDLSTSHALPNIKLFHDAWVARGFDHGRIDAILTSRNIPTVAAHTGTMRSGLTSTNPASTGAPGAAPPVVSPARGSAGGTAAEVAECKRTLQSGKVSWGGGTTWAPANIDMLCSGTKSAGSTIACFQSNVVALGWAKAIDTCR
jgi:hypothetical protein